MSTILPVAIPGVIRHPSGIPPRSRTDRRVSPLSCAMEALVERLSRLDSQAEGALRVVMFYDTLMRRRVDLPALARASAAWPSAWPGSGCTARDGPSAARPTAAKRPPRRHRRPPRRRSPSTRKRSARCGWNARPAGPLDDLLLDRLAIAAAAVVERYGPARTTMADPALVELAISADSDQAARARALRLLGFAADLPVRVAAVRSQLPLDQVGGLVCPARPVKAAPLADVGVLLATTLDPARFPSGVRAGIAAAERPDRSWRQARTALRFTTARQPVVHYDDLGALALLAQVPQDAARDNPDVAAIARMAGNPEDLETLDAYCHTGSLRRAAEGLHLHHSSVARRLDQLGKTLGIDLTEPTGLTRARLALTAWRLLND